VFGEFFAASFDVAVFGSWKATCAVGYFASYPRYAMRVGYVSSSYGAVHSAWRNKFRGKFVSDH